MREILGELSGLLILVIVFGALALVGLVGVGLRRFYEYARQGQAAQGCLTLILSLLGLAITMVACYLLAPHGKEPWFMLGALVVVIIGFFGIMLVPEGLGDD